MKLIQVRKTYFFIIFKLVTLLSLCFICIIAWTVTSKISLQPSVHVHVELPELKMENISCCKLFNGDEKEILKAEQLRNSTKKFFQSDLTLHRLARNCSALHALGYASRPLSSEEESYPIAFVIMMHEKTFQAERLLRLLYQPQNYYCLHIDRKAKREVHLAMRAIAACFPNVFLSSKVENVIYEHFSLLQADLNCMSDLIKRASDWKYLINLASSVLPLRTNLEMVKVMKIYNGTNDIEGRSSKTLPKYSYRNKYYYVWIFGRPVPIYKKSPPPFGIKIQHGSTYGIFSRQFIEFIFHDKQARALLEWLKYSHVPDEHFFTSLHHLKNNADLHTPGGYDGDPGKKEYLASHTVWYNKYNTCGGKWSKHHICLFGTRDLHRLAKRKEFFANKFDPEFDYIPERCISEWLANKTPGKGAMIDLSFYRNLKFVLRTKSSV